MNSLPIGIFDSGIGGLTVLSELIKQLPNEGTLYLGDTARVPYGAKSKETITEYSREIASFLENQGIKLLIVACNTASAFAVETLTKELTIPVIGVIEPGARAAVESSKTKRIGVIGTESTIRANAYHDGIKAIDNDIEVFQKACPIFVPLAEEGWTSNEVTKLTAKRYLTEMTKKDIDVLVLGCTHYPLLKEAVASVMGSNVSLVCSADATARKVSKTLIENNIEVKKEDSTPIRKFFITDSKERFERVGESFFGSKINAELVKLGS
ncbi:MAG: glutamate racemase [Deltaproteobacteria bacterium]|nr:glutamate racemase [Deltaproteobacteria bacterium]